MVDNDLIRSYAGGHVGYDISNEIECSNCGKIYSENIRICEVCGADIVAAHVVERVDPSDFAERFHKAYELSGRYIPDPDALLSEIQEERRAKLLATKEAKEVKIKRKRERKLAKRSKKLAKKQLKLEKKRKKQQKRKDKKEYIIFDEENRKQLKAAHPENRYVAPKDKIEGGTNSFSNLEPSINKEIDYNIGEWMGSVISEESYKKMAKQEVDIFWPNMSTADFLKKVKGYKNVSRVVRG